LLVIHTLNRADSLIVGKTLTVAAAGGLFMARTFTLTIAEEAIRPIGRVLFPVLSLVQGDARSESTAYLVTTRAVATLIFPILGGVCALAATALRLFLGEGWLHIVPALRFLCGAGMMMVLVIPLRQRVMASGDSRTVFILSLASGVL